MPASDYGSIHTAVSRRVAIAGASGLVGHHILRGLLADDTVSEVHALCRRDLTLKHPKLVVHLVDFGDLPTLPPIDELYLALGTTIKQAGSQAAFRAIDLEANLTVARRALDAGVRRIALVSAAGADARSGIFYNRVKGELEEALSALALEALLIVRPSLLLGDRATLGQTPRPLERWATIFSKLAGGVIPLAWRPVAAQSVAEVLLARLPSSKRKNVLSSAQIQALNASS